MESPPVVPVATKTDRVPPISMKTLSDLQPQQHSSVQGKQEEGSESSFDLWSEVMEYVGVASISCVAYFVLKTFF